MRFTSKVLYAVGVVAAIAVTASAADARVRHTPQYRQAPSAYDGAYAYGGDSEPGRGRYFVYGANHTPYGWDLDNPRDFQLQGTH
jgi:hypothetical protein